MPQHHTTAGTAARLIALRANSGTIDGTRVLSRPSIDAMTEVTTPGKPYDLGLGWMRLQVRLGSLCRLKPSV
jgi:hypothetical protein